MSFLPPPSIRKILAVPTQDKIDFRAACFCHKNIIDIGFVCSVCLSSKMFHPLLERQLTILMTSLLPTCSGVLDMPVSHFGITVCDTFHVAAFVFSCLILLHPNHYPTNQHAERNSQSKPSSALTHPGLSSHPPTLALGHHPPPLLSLAPQEDRVPVLAVRLVTAARREPQIRLQWGSYLIVDPSGMDWLVMLILMEREVEVGHCRAVLMFV